MFNFCWRKNVFYIFFSVSGIHVTAVMHCFLYLHVGQVPIPGHEVAIPLSYVWEHVVEKKHKQKSKGSNGGSWTRTHVHEWKLLTVTFMHYNLKIGVWKRTRVLHFLLSFEMNSWSLPVDVVFSKRQDVTEQNADYKIKK